MENSSILALVFELKDKIVASELYKNLKKKEKFMLEDQKCFKLLMEYQNAQSNYNEAKRFEKYGADVLTSQKKLSEIKFLIDENSFIKEYNKVYKEFSKYIKSIEKILFNGIIKEKREIDIE